MPATRIPGSREGKRSGTVVSLLLHALLLIFILAPASSHVDPNLKPIELGAGGPGPAGGGGGGSSGSGGVRYVAVAPPPKPVAVAVTPPLVVQPPKPQEPILPELEIPKLATAPKEEIKVQLPVVGVGGGSGTDGTRGNGPGSGGGIGSGIGTGNGSGIGPGTGGGNTKIHEPQVIELLLPPLPSPPSLRGSRVLLEFDVDATGRVISFKHSPTGDRGYDRKLDDLLRLYRFRPGTTVEGVPVRAKTQFWMELGG